MALRINMVHVVTWHCFVKTCRQVLDNNPNTRRSNEMRHEDVSQCATEYLFVIRNVDNESILICR